ncbi:Sad1-interacting factor 2 [Escovopsis weberi]|uniref:Sad1-interacting factor 2 n=1 Tax=Escovopsis weberi TaxID=150374 RepID=A0A0M8MRM1_ESCWE|nr:Sad1-interacting factor 2 [Escovopsis weberi]
MESSNPVAEDSVHEDTPLLPQEENRSKPPRTVTFSANPVTRTISPDPRFPLKNQTQQQQQPQHHNVSLSTSPGGSSRLGGPPMLAALNSKLRRRNSQGSVPGLPAHLGPKIGPQRSTKKTEKLKLLPNPDLGDEGEDEETGRDVYSQYTRIKDPTARRDAARLGKADRDRLPRVTAYCTANRYEMEGLMRFLKGRGKTRGANPKLIDECIYTPYMYGKTPHSQGQNDLLSANLLSGDLGQPDSVEDTLQAHTHARAHAQDDRAPASDPVQGYERRHSTGSEAMDGEAQRQEFRSSVVHSANFDAGFDEPFDLHSHHLADASKLPSDELLAPTLPSDAAIGDTVPDFDIQVHTPEVFLFDYGVVVIWGMSEVQEAKFLRDISKFEIEKLAPDDVESEHFNFYYTREYQARIYNDFITLRDKNNYMTKLAISHALAQSVKTSLFEELIASTIDTCKDIPTQIALTGKIALSRTQINMQIGELFILRINIHLNGSVLDTPELFWVEPQLEPVYQAVRSYLEMDQRVGLLTERLDVIADLLAVLKDQLSTGHDEKLEWIVIVLVAMEIVVAAINIVVDVYAGDV